MTALLSPNSGVKRAAEEGGAKSDPRNNRPGEVQTVGSPSDFTIQTDCLQSTSIQPIQRCFDDSDFDNGASVNAEIIWSDNYTLASSPGYLVSDIVPYYAITDSYWLSYADTGIDFFFDTNGDSSADIGITPNYSQSTVLSANSSIGISIFTLSGSSVTPRTGSCSGTITRKAGDHLKIIGTSNSWWQLRVDTACLFGSSGSNVRSLSYLEDYLGFDISPDYFSGAAMNLTAATAPSITGITPTSGSTSGGTSVTITGARLTGATVSFGGTNGTVTSNTGSSLVVTSPAHAAGTVTVLVATSFGSATQSFTFVSPPPTITNISPTTGTASGGTNVTITGTQLTGASVTIGGASATVVSNSGTALVVTSPAHAAGVVNIVLTTTGGSITRASAFTYVSTTPTITSISPATGTSTGGETVVISGTNLSNVTSITFGGQAATILSRTATTVTLVTPAAAPAPTLPTDPYYSNGTLWGLSGTYGVNSPQAWGRTKGSPDVVVAVIDTGILPHADRGQIVAGYDFVSDSNMANDGTGWDSDPTDQGDWISASENSSGFFAGCGQSDSSWHGTHVAGTIAGASNNIGIVGVAPNVKVQPVRVLGKCGGYTSDIIAGIYWASGISPVGAPTNATPADVINMSLGGSGSCTSSMQTAIDSANSRGVTVVVAAGNSNTNAITAEPANCNGVVVVGATDSNGRRASFSNYGSVVDVSAPGVGIYSTLNTGRTSAALDTYVSYNGTSMATPHVAGVVALMLSINPLLTPSQVETKLKATVRSFGGATCDVANSSLLCGSGIVNAGSALQ
jgi:serine protease